MGMSTAYGGIGALARYLGSLPGRKHVVFYSGGYPMDPSAIAESVVVELCAPLAQGKPDETLGVARFDGMEIELTDV